MLKIANSEDLTDIKAFCENSVLGTRISCIAEGYCFDKSFIELWLSYESNILNSILLKFGDSFTVLTKRMDISDEVSCFLAMSKAKSITSNVDINISADYNAAIKKAYVFNGGVLQFDSVPLKEEYCKAVYRLISRNIPNSFAEDEESYLAFLSDYLFREKRNKARGKLILEDGKLCACALTAAETQGCALISGVASDNACRGKGHGKRVVLSLVGELLMENKQTFVIALNDSAQKFYEHIGFKECEKIYIYERK